MKIEILVNNPEFEEKINEEGLSDGDYQYLIARYELDDVEKVEDVNIGTGADFMVVLMQIVAGGLTLITLGKNIEDGLHWWIATGKKIFSIHKRNELIAVDENGAIAMAIHFLVERQKEEIDAIQVIDKHTIQLSEISELMGDGRDKTSLISQPENLYILTIVVNNWRTYVLSVQADGKIDVVKCYEIASGFFEIDEE